MPESQAFRCQARTDRVTHDTNVSESCGRPQRDQITACPDCRPCQLVFRALIQSSNQMTLGNGTGTGNRRGLDTRTHHTRTPSPSNDSHTGKPEIGTSSSVIGITTTHEQASITTHFIGRKSQPRSCVLAPSHSSQFRLPGRRPNNLTQMRHGKCK